jgi:hypothetical protein
MITRNGEIKKYSLNNKGNESYKSNFYLCHYAEKRFVREARKFLL